MCDGCHKINFLRLFSVVKIMEKMHIKKVPLKSGLITEVAYAGLSIFFKSTSTSLFTGSTFY
jgi:hypothetical protein